MWLDVLALGILAAFAAVGAVRGAVATAMGLLTLGIAYASGLTLGPILGPGLGGQLGLSPPFDVALVGSGAFLMAFFVMGIVSTIVRRMTRRDDGVRSARDRFLGGIFGSLRGCLIVVLLSWLAIWVDALRATGTVDSLPELGRSAAAAVTSEIVESGLEAAMGNEDPAGRMVARMAARPGVALVEFQSVLDNPNFEKLRADEGFWRSIEGQNVDAALNRVSFQDVLQDDTLRRRLGDLGLIDAAAVDDPRVFREQMAAVFDEVGPRIHGLKNDPEVQAMMEDPEVVAMIQNGDTLGLLVNPRFRSVVERVTSQASQD